MSEFNHVQAYLDIITELSRKPSLSKRLLWSKWDDGAVRLNLEHSSFAFWHSKWRSKPPASDIIMDPYPLSSLILKGQGDLTRFKICEFTERDLQKDKHYMQIVKGHFQSELVGDPVPVIVVPDFSLKYNVGACMQLSNEHFYKRFFRNGSITISNIEKRGLNLPKIIYHQTEKINPCRMKEVLDSDIDECLSWVSFCYSLNNFVWG